MPPFVPRWSRVPRLCGSAGALLVALAVLACERPLTGNSGSQTPPPSARGEPKPQPDAAGATCPATAAAEPDPPLKPTPLPATGLATPTPRKYIAYYFHRTLRCAACLSIEQQSQAAIELGYGAELSTGRLEWQPVNIEEPGHEHFEQDFALQTQSLVLVEMDGDAVTRSKLLPKVWELLDNPAGFQEYVVSEVALFISGG